MAFMLEDRELHRITQAEAIALAEAVPTLERTELLLGVLVERVSKTPEHERVKLRLNRWLTRGTDPLRYDVFVESPLSASDPHSLPEPDLMVCASGRRSGHPAAALLVVEVAVSSLRIDSGVKAAIYAASAVPEYWVVDVDERRVLVLTDPGPDGYATRRTLLSGEACAAPAHVDVEPIALATLFAGAG